MPRLKQVIDQESGEVYHVETTKQAKRRHQRYGAQHKPTPGQINAADIWNKQEEKIKRDREREERRKTNKAKQEAKEAKQREHQEEMLKKGKISIEDTWGKVNASQIRLNRFFGAPKSANKPVIRLSEEDHKIPGDVLDQSNPVTKVQEHEQQPILLEEDLDGFFTNSPLSPEAEKNKGLNPPPVQEQSITLPSDSPVCAAHTTTTSGKRKSPSISQTMMPPPKRPLLSGPRTTSTGKMAEPVRNSPQLAVAPSRSPLKEFSASDANVRANNKSKTLVQEKCHNDYLPPATQVVRDTLSGLCSQDFKDDFGDDSEEDLPGKKMLDTHEQATTTMNAFLRRGSTSEASMQGSGVLSDIPTTQESERGQSDTESNEFDDEGVDDESLLSLAATQYLKQELFTFSKTPSARVLSSPKVVPPPTGSPTTLTSPLQYEPRALGDSFAMDGLDDGDLLEGLEYYEVNIAHSDGKDLLSSFENWNKHGDSSNQQISRKSRRVLPWVKNPISYSFDGNTYDDENALTPSPSPSSQAVMV